MSIGIHTYFTFYNFEKPRIILFNEISIFQGGHILPAGSVAGICLLHMHHNEKYFPRADQFIPERFEDRNHERHAYAYLPFSTGPRNCIGWLVCVLRLNALK